MKKWELYESMRKQGMTYQQIADACGCSRQNVYIAIARRKECMARGITPERCVYPALREWMNRNRVSVAELLRRIYGHNALGYTRNRFDNVLRGRADLKKREIDALLRVTGMTYEELFR